MKELGVMIYEQHVGGENKKKNRGKTPVTVYYNPSNVSVSIFYTH
jgi:hypothetical protein